MAIAKYHEFLLLVDNVQRDERGIYQFTVQVARTPDGGVCEPQIVKLPVPDTLQSLIRQLEKRQLSERQIIDFGELLSQLLFPPETEVRYLFERNRDALSNQQDQGLRLCLQLAPALFSVPWEYLYMQREKGKKDSTGFLALDPSISIVRHHALIRPSAFNLDPAERRLLLVMASPRGDGFPNLDLDQDRAILSEALNATPGITLDPLPDATIQMFAQRLQNHTDIVHFAGHGVFKQTGCGESLFDPVGVGQVVFAKPDNTPDPVTADVFATNLARKGVQLVVLGACQTGRTDQENVWSGVVDALMRVGIPAAIAMQFKIFNDSARDFTQSFYQTLAGNHLLDQAVSAGRIAIFNRFHANPDDEGWRDWGVPVVYLRPGADFVLPVTSPAQAIISSPIETWKNIKEFVRKNRLEEALNLLLSIEDFEEDATLLMRRLQDVRKKERVGTESSANAAVEYGRIASAILELASVHE